MTLQGLASDSFMSGSAPSQPTQQPSMPQAPSTDTPQQAQQFNLGASFGAALPSFADSAMQEIMPLLMPLAGVAPRQPETTQQQISLPPANFAPVNVNENISMPTTFTPQVQGYAYAPPSEPAIGFSFSPAGYAPITPGYGSWGMGGGSGGYLPPVQDQQQQQPPMLEGSPFSPYNGGQDMGPQTVGYIPGVGPGGFDPQGNWVPNTSGGDPFVGTPNMVGPDNAPSAYPGTAGIPSGPVPWSGQPPSNPAYSGDQSSGASTYNGTYYPGAQPQVPSLWDANGNPLPAVPSYFGGGQDTQYYLPPVMSGGTDVWSPGTLIDPTLGPTPMMATPDVWGGGGGDY